MPKYTIANILGHQKSNNEFYTPKQTVIDLIKKINLPKNKIIWCPFDKANSEFVIEFKKRNYKVIIRILIMVKIFITMNLMNIGTL